MQGEEPGCRERSLHAGRGAWVQGEEPGYEVIKTTTIILGETYTTATLINSGVGKNAP